MFSKRDIRNLVSDPCVEKFIDSSGKILIRLPERVYRIEFDKNEINKVYHNHYQIYLNLLHYEDKIPRKPLKSWVKSEYNYLTTLTSVEDILSDIDKFAVSLNQSALIASFYGYSQLAAEICYKTIDLFYLMSEFCSNKKYLSFVLQPWINLIRLGRLNKSHASFFDKISLFTKEAVYDTNKYKKNVLESYRYCKTNNHKIINVVSNCMTIEALRFNLAVKAFSKLITSEPIYSSYLDSVRTEACIIALVSVGKIDKALKYANDAFCFGFFPMAHIFAFRRAEILTYFGAIERCIPELHHLISFCNDFDYNSKININDLNFCLAVVELLWKYKKYKPIKKILYSCLKAFLKLNDEPGVIAVLTKLAKLSPEYKQVLVDKLSETEYCFFKNKHSNHVTVSLKDCKKILQQVYLFIEMITPASV